MHMIGMPDSLRYLDCHSSQFSTILINAPQIIKIPAAHDIQFTQHTLMHSTKERRLHIP